MCASDAVGERRSLDQLHHERTHVTGIFQAVDMRDVRMIERGEHLRLAAETRQAMGIVRHGGQQHIDRDVAIQLRVVRAIDLAMPPAPRADTISYGPRRVPGDKAMGRRRF